jgi:hypothetical protein
MGNRLVVVRPKDVPEGVKEEDVPTHIVGESWLRAFPDDFDLIRYVGETDEQVEAREKAAKSAKAPASSTTSTSSRSDSFA